MSAAFPGLRRSLVAILRGLRPDEALAAGGVDQARAERIRELVRIVQETGIGEVTIEEGETRITDLAGWNVPVWT